MKILRRAAASVSAMWRAISWRAQGLRRRSIKHVLVDEEPHRPRRNIVYVRQGADGPAFGFMACPCGCGATLHLRFTGERRPRWSFSLDGKGRVTLRPSVWRGIDCRSHFFVSAGKIEWC